MAEQNERVSDVIFQDPDEAILPDDFTIGDDNYDLEAGVGERTEDVPAAQTPTTEEPQTETDVAEPVAQEPTEPITAPIEPVVPQIPQTIKVKFNHEEREIGLDEAALLAQKGMNYDKLQQKIADLEARSNRGELLAKQLGYQSTEEMYEAAGKNFVEKQVQELVDAGNTEAMARFLVEQQMAKAAAAVPKSEPAPEEIQQESTPKTPLDGMSTERRAELMEFVKAHPGVTKLPDEVIQANKAGTRLLVAYERYQNKAALNELAILKQNQAAAEKAPVSGVTGKAANTKPQEEDPFLKGFESDSW